MKAGSERGAALLWVLMGLLVAGVLLNVAAIVWFRTEQSVRIRDLKEAALFEARGGLRVAAGRWRASGRFEPIRRTDDWGHLEVREEEGRLISTFTFELGEGRTVRRTVSALRRGRDVIDWREP